MDRYIHSALTKMALISLPRPGHTTAVLLEADPMSVGGETSFCAMNRLVYLMLKLQRRSL